MTASKPPDEGTPNDAQCKAATPEELCEGALRHYDDLSTKAHHWMNQIPQAIRFWYLEKPRLERELQAAESRAASAEKDAARLDWLEDITKCYWITIQTQPSAKRVFSGQGLGIRAAIDAASGEAG